MTAPKKSKSGKTGSQRPQTTSKPKSTVPNKGPVRIYDMEEIAVAGGIVLVGGILLASALFGSGEEDSFGRQVSRGLKQAVSFTIHSTT